MNEHEKFIRHLNEFQSEYIQLNGEKTINFDFIHVFHKALFSLISQIQDSENPKVTWDFPVLTILSPIEMNHETRQVKYFTIKLESMEDIGNDKFKEAFSQSRELNFLRKITGDLAVKKKNGGYIELIPPELKDKSKKEIREAYRPQTVAVKFPADFKGSVHLEIHPLMIDEDAGTDYYRIRIWFKFESGPPETEEERTKLIEAFESEFEKLFSQEKFPEGDFKRFSPIEGQIPGNLEIIKAGLHVERQKLGVIPDKTKQLTFFDLLDSYDLKEKAKENNIEVRGIELTTNQEKALHAIQTFLSRTNYKGNAEGSKCKGENSFKFTGYLPAIKFTPAEYLEAFGLKKIKTKRGFMEFSGGEREEALKALSELHNKQFLFIYTRKYWITEKGKREERFDVIKTTSPLIKITEGYIGLTREEKDSLISGTGGQEKLRIIAVEPSPILVQDIDSYFVLKPANYKQEIDILVKKPSKFIYLFIDYLMTETELKRRKNDRLTIKIKEETLAYKLRMDSYIKTRNWKRIRGILKKCFSIATELKYINSYMEEEKYTGGLNKLIILNLNPEKIICQEKKQKSLP